MLPFRTCTLTAVGSFTIKVALMVKQTHGQMERDTNNIQEQLCHFLLLSQSWR